MYDLRELLVGSFLSGISPLFSHRNDRSTKSATDPFPATFGRRRVTIILFVLVRSLPRTNKIPPSRNPLSLSRARNSKLVRVEKIEVGTPVAFIWTLMPVGRATNFGNDAFATEQDKSGRERSKKREGGRGGVEKRYEGSEEEMGH